MNGLRWLLIIFGCVSAVALVSWFSRAYLVQTSVPYLLESVLQQTGIDEFQVDVIDIDIDKARLRSLVFDIAITSQSYVDKTGIEKLRLKLRGIDIDYRYQALLAGRVDHLVIKSIQVTPVAAEKSASADTAGDYAMQVSVTDADDVAMESNRIRIRQFQDIFEADWRSMIPVQFLRVEKISLAREIAGNFSRYDYRLVFSDSDTNVSLNIDAHGNGITRTLRAVTDSVEWLSLIIDDKKTAQVELRSGDNLLDINYSFDFHQLMQWLNDFDSINKNTSAQTEKSIKSGGISIPGLVRGELHLDTSVINTAADKSLFQIETPLIQTEGLTLEGVAASVYFDYESSNKQHRLSLLPDSVLRYKVLKSGAYRLLGDEVRLAGKLEMDSDSWYSTGDFSIKTLAFMSDAEKADSVALAIRDISTSLQINGSTLDVTGEFRPEKVPALVRFNLMHAFSSGAGQLSFTTVDPVNLNQGVALSQLVKKWKYDFDLFNGEIAIQAEMKWRSEVPLNLTVRTEFFDVGGAYKDIVFSGINSRQNLQLLPVLQTMSNPSASRVGQTGLIKVKHIDAGILIDRLSLQMVLRQSEYGDLPQLEVHNFNANLLEGHFSSKQFTFDLNQPVNHIDIRVRSLDLSKIVATQQFSGLKVSGKLDGWLPVEINSEGVFVHNGTFSNAGRKGFIRYRPEVSVEQLKSNPLSEIALTALRDFRYHKLAAEIDYQSDGELTIALHMNGMSPELADRKMVNLNINTEQNVLSLLKGLRYANGLNESLDERVRSRYRDE